MSLKIEPILCNVGSMDNYAYVLTDTSTDTVAVVDAPEESVLVDYFKQNKIKPEYILTTHHHEDHTNANKALKKRYKLQIFGSEIEHENIPGISRKFSDGETFKFGELTAQAILTPGHTNGHVLWYFPEEKALFTGDMLFNLCIGGLFEGTPQQMWQSIAKIKSLPDDVRFYPGHEYTRSNLNYLFHLRDSESMEAYMRFLEEKSRNGEPFVGNTLGLEKRCNPYLRPQNEKEFVDLFEGY